MGRVGTMIIVVVDVELVVACLGGKSLDMDLPKPLRDFAFMSV